jgi:hypothetical protein
MFAFLCRGKAPETAVTVGAEAKASAVAPLTARMGCGVVGRVARSKLRTL